jgi:gliding motility-associated-like protein
MSATFISSSPSCIGNNDGYVQISVIGGTEPYLFGWNNSFIDIPYITGLINGEYNIVVTDANNCLVNLGTTILIDEQVDCIKIPNAFTPNSDGVNDTWIIENIDIFPGSYTFVYNRWGQEMYVGRPDGEPWDGKFNSKYVPVGTYLYVINLFNGTPPYVGIVTVMQ